MHFLKRCNKETKPSKFVAKCSYHKCQLTPNQMKLKHCLFKPKIGDNCPHLVKLQHTYWVEREIIKQKRKEKKYN